MSIQPGQISFGPTKTHKDYLRELEKTYGKEKISEATKKDVGARTFFNLLQTGTGAFPHSLACDLSRRLSVTL